MRIVLVEFDKERLDEIVGKMKGNEQRKGQEPGSVSRQHLSS